MKNVGSSDVSPRETPLLIAFADLTYFTRTAREMRDVDLAAFCQDLYERVALPVDAAGGRVVKFMGDSALIVFPLELADRGVTCLLELRKSIDSWAESLKIRCRLVVKAHAGTAIYGTFGAGSSRQLDVIGSDVNSAAVLDSSGFSISVPAFRALAPETRRRFKKHTPPVTYIPVEAKHC